MSNPSAPNPSTENGASPLPPRDRGAFVITMIAIATLLFVATEGLLYYRWATMVEPTCVLIVETNESLRGAEIQVDGLPLAAPHKVIIGAGDRFSVPFYLEPGTYTVKIKVNDTDVFSSQVTLTPIDRGRRLDLKTFHPPRSATTAPSAAAQDMSNGIPL
jgi:hypothetical protein